MFANIAYRRRFKNVPARITGTAHLSSLNRHLCKMRAFRALARVRASCGLGAADAAFTFRDVIERAAVLIVVLAACGSARAQDVTASTTPHAAAPAQIDRMQHSLAALSHAGDSAIAWSAAI